MFNFNWMLKVLKALGTNRASRNAIVKGMQYTTGAAILYGAGVATVAGLHYGVKGVKKGVEAVQAKRAAARGEIPAQPQPQA